MDLRRRVVAYVRGGGSKAEAARRFGVHHGCVFDWITRDRLEAKKPGPRKAHKMDMEALQQAVECQPEVMGKELAVQFGVRPSTICYALKRLNISRKKTWTYKESDNEKRKAYLKRWWRYRMQGKQFVYVDESAFAPTAERTHGFARKGKRVHGQRSGQRRPRTSFLAALCGKQMLAPFLFQGTCNTAVFNAWLEQELCPHLTPNSVVIMDNATFHKSTLTQQLIQQRQATLLFLPPYSPDLNPIEKRFGTLKRYRSYTPEISLNLLIQTYG